jgi:sugar/nucleoside kinase (ribokinase family)
MHEQCDAIVAGHICLDIIPAIGGGGFSFSPGRLLEVGPALLSTGGAVSNAGLALYKLGVRTRLMGKIGADYFGQSVRTLITAHDAVLAKGMTEVPGEVSSYTIILNPLDADRMFLHCPGANNTFGVQDIDYQMIAKARLFHFGYPPLLRRVIENDGAELAEIFRRAKDTGITTSLDMSMPDPRSFSGQVNWPAILSATLPYVDVYMPGLEETLFMLYPARFRELTASEGNVGSVSAALLSSVATDLLTMGPAVVGLKLGHMGLYLRTANETAWKKAGKACPKSTHLWVSRELWSPCFQVRVVGTTGAGDATIAGFLAALLRGCSPEESVTMACAVGGCNVEAADALGGLRSWDETQARVRNGWPRHTLECSLPGWQLLSDAEVWRGVWSRDSGDKQAL